MVLLGLLVGGCASGVRSTADTRLKRIPAGYVVTELPAPPSAPGQVRATNHVATHQQNPEISAGERISLVDWCSELGIGQPSIISAYPLKLSVSVPGGLAVFEAGNQAVWWAGTCLYLGQVPRVEGGTLVLNRIELDKKCRPLLGSATGALHRIQRIVIDPGHGGLNTGATNIVDGTLEKELTLDWAFRLAELLSGAGFDVRLTRTTDIDLSPQARAQFATSVKPDLFLSLHFNSAYPDRVQHGIETYCLTPTGTASSMNRGYDDPIQAVYPNNTFDETNIQWAYRIHRSLVQLTGARDRGIRHARFIAVLRNQRCPALLIEGGFLSHPVEARRISDPAYRQKLAEAIANALIK